MDLEDKLKFKVWADVTHRIINSQLHDSSIINKMTHLSSDIYPDINFLDDLD